MADKPVVGLRYCGGCNPRYHRRGAVQQLEKLLPQLEFVPLRPGESCPVAVVVCGCPARCVDVSGMEGKLIRVCAPEDLDQAAAALQRIICNE